MADEDLNPPEPDAAPAQRSPRDALLARVAARVEEQRQAEIDTYPSSDPTPGRDDFATHRPVNTNLGEREEDREYHDPFVQERPQPAPEPVRAEPEAPVASPHAAPPQPHLYPVTINGYSHHVTLDQMQALAAQGAVANLALYEYQNHRQRQPEPASQPVERQPLFDEQQFSNAAQAIQYGDGPSAAQALRDLVSHVVSRTPPAPVVDTNRIITEAEHRARLAARQERDNEIIRQEYADVISDQWLSNMAAMRANQIVQEQASLGRSPSNLDVLREAGNFVLEKMGRPRPGMQAQQQPGETGSAAPQAPNLVVRRSAADIEGRKRAAPRAVGQVIDRRSAAPVAPRAPTTAEVVDWMRSKRGQPPIR